MALEKQLITVEEFEAFIERPENTDRLLELIDGEILEKVPTELHALAAANLSGELRAYAKTHKLGRVTVEPRHQLPPEQQNPLHPHSHVPDVAFTSRERKLPIVSKGAVPQMPDLAIEIQSPGQSDWLMREKADYYLDTGSRMVWLVYPDRQLVEVLTVNSRRILTRDDTLEGGEVLPDFQLLVGVIFEDD